ncbi:MAG: class I SAM-dependent RNA methyltransferase, partial [Bacilli bacterium]|nr:class I SAM-dependent RNA methyltransferase [Bacilli bacterium]
MEVTIDRFNDTGEGIGIIDGQVVFVPKTVPGDIVKIKNINNYKNYMRADEFEIVKTSNIREKAKCPYFDFCGGCQIMNINYQEQLNYKKNKVINIFKKFGNIDINPKIMSDKQYSYRNKIIVEVRNGIISLNKYHSHDTVNIDKCLLVSDNINDLIKLISKRLDLTSVKKIMIRESTNNDIMIVFYGNVDIDKTKNILKDKVESGYINDKLIIGNKYIKTKLKEYTYTLSPESFFQVNYNITIKL